MANDLDRSAGLVAIGVLNVILGALGIIFYILLIIAGFDTSGVVVNTSETTAELEWQGWVGVVLTAGLFISGFLLLSGYAYGAMLANAWAVCWIIWEIILLLFGVINWVWFIICGLVWPIILLIVVNTAEGDDVFNQPERA